MVKSASFFITQGPKGVTQISSFVKCLGLLTLISVRLFILERGNELCKLKYIQQTVDAHTAHRVKLVDESL